MFWVKQEGQYSELKQIKAGVPQGSVIGPLLYLLYTQDIPQPTGTTVGTFADDTAILAVGNSEEATIKLQKAVNIINKWTRKWRIKLNENKSVQIFFTNKKIKRQIPIFGNCSKSKHSQILGHNPGCKTTMEGT